jgi:16S rRNA (guanine(1405)-N(7))-methyltransferase
MTAETVERVRRSARYRGVDPELVARLAAEELPKAHNADDAVKRVKRRLHQAVGAFRRGHALAAAQGAWPVGDAEGLRAACAGAMRRHASTRERLPYLDTFYTGIWRWTGIPQRLFDLGCGLGPLALPWMEIGDATYHASDVDAGTLDTVRGFLEAIGQPHAVEVRDLGGELRATDADADVALMLKLVTTLDRQDGDAAARLMRTIRVRHAVVSFAARSLGGRGGRDRTYRERLDRLVRESGRVREVAEASVPNELVFVLTLDPIDG